MFTPPAHDDVITDDHQPPSHALFTAVEKAIWEELKLCGDEAKHMRLCEMFVSALQSGGPSVSSTGTIVITDVRTTELARAISLAQKWSSITQASPRARALFVSSC